MGCVNCKHAIEDIIVDIDVKNKYKTPIDNRVRPADVPADIEWGDTTPFVAPIECGRVIKVYDGDTITVASRLSMPGSPLYRFQIRLDGIDTPELKGKTESEKEIAILARDKLSKKILGKWVTLENVKQEKYGRVLAEVWYENDKGRTLCVNEWLVKKRLAVRYDGGTKKAPKNWKRYYNKKR